jgi:mono/diheme cytochrome c family protein
MRGGRPCFVLLNIAGVSMFLACGDRRTGDAPATDTVPAVSPAPASTDTVAPRESGRAIADSVRPATRGDSTPARTTAASPAAAPTRKSAAAPKRVTTPKPVLRPTPPPAAQRDTPPASTSSSTPPARDSAAAATPPAQAPETSTAAAAPPAQATDTSSPASAQATTPLRDEYHRAPLDTVSQQVYDGWKQYNLNCARCHGEDVMGTTIAPHLVTSLKPTGPINTKELFVQVVCAGRPAKGMPAWCPLGLEMDKIEAIHAYVKGRSEGKIRPGRPAVKSGG